MKTLVVFSTPHGTEKIPIEDVDSISKEHDPFVNLTVNVKNGKTLLVTNNEITFEETP